MECAMQTDFINSNLDGLLKVIDLDKLTSIPDKLGNAYGFCDDLTIIFPCDLLAVIIRQNTSSMFDSILVMD